MPSNCTEDWPDATGGVSGPNSDPKFRFVVPLTLSQRLPHAGSTNGGRVVQISVYLPLKAFLFQAPGERQAARRVSCTFQTSASTSYEQSTAAAA
jgi:hypothetical protein